MTQTNSPTLQSDSIGLIERMPLSGLGNTATNIQFQISEYQKSVYNIFQVYDLTNDGGVRLSSWFNLSDAKYLDFFNTSFAQRAGAVVKNYSYEASYREAPYRFALSSIIGFDRYWFQNGMSISDDKMIARMFIWDTLKELYELLTWDNGWNGYDACAPKYDAVISADKWIVQFFLEVGNWGKNWIRPNVSASGDGEVVFGWRFGSKRLTIYIGEQSAEYVKAWGPDMINDMDDGEADLATTRQLLWKWLVS